MSDEESLSCNGAQTRDIEDGAAARRAASVCRKQLHAAIARRDIEDVRRELTQIYDSRTSPLLKTGGIRRIQAFAPFVEAFLLTFAFEAEADGEGSELLQEMQLNFHHTHEAFGLTQADYDCVVKTADSLRGAGMAGLVNHGVFCKGTSLEGLVKPLRHESMFQK